MRTVAQLKPLLRNRCPEEAAIAHLKDQKAAQRAFRRDNQKFARRRVVTGLMVKEARAEVIEKTVDEASMS
jgi:hypothetical protein